MKAKILHNADVVSQEIKRFPLWSEISGTPLEPLVTEALAQITILPGPSFKPKACSFGDTPGHRLECPAHLTSRAKPIKVWLRDLWEGRPNIMLVKLKLDMAHQYALRNL